MRPIVGMLLTLPLSAAAVIALELADNRPPWMGITVAGTVATAYGIGRFVKDGK